PPLRPRVDRDIWIRGMQLERQPSRQRRRARWWERWAALDRTGGHPFRLTRGGRRQRLGPRADSDHVRRARPGYAAIGDVERPELRGHRDDCARIGGWEDRYRHPGLLAARGREVDSGRERCSHGQGCRCRPRKDLELDGTYLVAGRGYIPDQ